MDTQKLIELEQAVVRCTRMLDALVTLHCGWNEESKGIYTEAQKLVLITARRLSLERQLRDLNESASKTDYPEQLSDQHTQNCRTHEIIH